VGPETRGARVGVGVAVVSAAAVSAAVVVVPVVVPGTPIPILRCRTLLAVTGGPRGGVGGACAAVTPGTRPEVTVNPCTCPEETAGFDTRLLGDSLDEILLTRAINPSSDDEMPVCAVCLALESICDSGVEGFIEETSCSDVDANVDLGRGIPDGGREDELGREG
jgi:hypothetical protein